MASHAHCGGGGDGGGDEGGGGGGGGWGDAGGADGGKVCVQRNHSCVTTTPRRSAQPVGDAARLRKHLCTHGAYAHLRCRRLGSHWMRI